MGAEYYVVKPFDIDVLINRIRDIKNYKPTPTATADSCYDVKETKTKYIEINDRISFDMSQNFKQHSLVDGEEYELYLSKSEAIESIEKRILFKRLQEICFKKEDRDFSLTQLREAVKLLTA